MTNSEKGKCPNCGSRNWIEESEWHWMRETNRFNTAPNSADFGDSVQIDQDGSCKCTYRCADCGWKVPQGSEDGAGTSSWDEFWEVDDADADENIENNLDRLNEAMNPVLDRLTQRNAGVDPEATMSIPEIVDWAEKKFGQDDADVAELRELHEEYDSWRERRVEDED